MKRILLFAMALLILLGSVNLCWAYETPEDDVLPEDYLYTSYAEATLTISSSGAGTINVVCNGNALATRINAKVYLQKRVNGVWTEIPLNGHSHFLIVEYDNEMDYTIYTTLSSGTYRVRVYFKVFSDLNYETFNIYSLPASC